MKGMNVLKGSNEFIFGGPFIGHLSDERETEVEGTNMVIKSKNGSVGQIPVYMLETVKDKALNIYYEILASQKTMPGLRKSLTEGGDIPLGRDLFWIKSLMEIETR